jgi:hypothetical protein
VPVPTQDTAIVAEGGALLTSMYVSKPVIAGIVQALTARLQQIENDFWAMLNAIQLPNNPLPGGPWSILDQIGAIVGAVRNADYLALIRLQAKVNRARGLAEDVLSLAAIMTGVVPPVYIEDGIAAFYLGCWNIAGSFPLFRPLLSQVRAAGTYGLFHYTTWADGNDFEWGSRYDSAAGQGTWGSRYDSTVGGLFVAAVAI